MAWENDLNLRLRSVEAESVANASLHVHWGLDCEDLTGLVSGTSNRILSHIIVVVPDKSRIDVLNDSRQ